MRTDPNMRAGYNVSGGGAGGPTIVNITEHRPGWLGQAVVGLCAGQFMLMLLILFLVVSPRVAGTPDEDAARRKSVAEAERELELKTSVLNDVVKELAGERNVVTNLQKAREANAELLADLAIAKEGVPKIRAEYKGLVEDKNNYEAKWKKAATRADDAEKRLAALEEKLAHAGPTTVSDLATGDGVVAAERRWYSWFTEPLGIAITVVVIVGLALAAVVALRGQALDQRFPEDDAYEPKQGEPPLREPTNKSEPEAKDNIGP